MQTVQELLIAQQLQRVQTFLEVQHLKQAQLDTLKKQLETFEPTCSVVLPIRAIARILEQDFQLWQRTQLYLIEKGQEALTAHLIG
jgi:hypothetical protein